MLTLFDFNNLYYSSFYISGFQELLGDDFQLSHKFPKFLEEAEFQEHKSKLLAVLLLYSDTHDCWLAIDTRDGCKEESYHTSLLKFVDLYFKVNFNEDEINASEFLTSHKSKIIPLPPFFPVLPKGIALNPRLRPARHAGWTLKEVLKRYKARKNILSLEKVYQLPELPKKLDVFFVMTFYQNSKHLDDIELRYDLMQSLKHDKNINATVGFIAKEKLPGKFEELRLKPFSFESYMRNLAQSKVAIYVRGLHQCVSFKFSEQLALGLPVVGQCLQNNKVFFKDFPHIQEQYDSKSSEEIFSNIKSLLKDDNERSRLSLLNSDLFKSKLTPEKVCLEILKTVQELHELEELFVNEKI